MPALEIETTVCGIPCIARVTYYHHQEPMGPTADSDWDCYGYTECDFDILDRRGRPAPWLERKLTDKESSRIKEEISEHMEQMEGDFE